MADNLVLNMMIGHHSLIDVYFAIFEDNLKDKHSSVKESLENFSWQIEKHFFVEERAIFRFYNQKNENIHRLIVHIKGEHIQMLKLLDEIKIHIDNEKKIDITTLKDLLAAHQKLEEEQLYPILDNEFDMLQKKEIVQKIKDIILRDNQK